MKRIIKFFRKIFKVHSPSEKNMPIYCSQSDYCRMAHDALETGLHNSKATKADLYTATLLASHYLEKIIIFTSGKWQPVKHAHDRLKEVLNNPKATKADLKLAMANAAYDLYLEMGEVRE